LTQVYPWYEIVDDSEELEQGDFIEECEVIIPSYTPVETDTTDTRKFRAKGTSRTYDVVIISQTCTLENGQPDDYVLICPRNSYSDYLRTNIEANHTLKSIQANLEQIRLGRQLRYYLLNKCDLPDLTCEMQIVELDKVFSVPYDTMKQMAKSSGKRLRLLSPYKEHLAQAFAYYYMRVALPIPIDSLTKPKVADQISVKLAN